MRIFELFDRPQQFTLKHGRPEEYTATATLLDGSELLVLFSRDYTDHSKFGVEFTRNDATHVTGDGGEVQVFSTVISIVMQFISRVNPDKLHFEAEATSKGKRSRMKLYRRLVNTLADKAGYDKTIKSEGWREIYTLTRK